MQQQGTQAATPASANPQVCLAAERCGHLRFDARADMWWSGEGFHCTEGQEGSAAGGAAAAAAAAVGFWDIYCKVCMPLAGWPGWLAGLDVHTGCPHMHVQCAPTHSRHRRH